MVSDLIGDDLGDLREVDEFIIGEECCGILAQQAMAFEVIFCKNKEKNKSRDYYEKQRIHEKKEAKVEICLS